MTSLCKIALAVAFATGASAQAQTLIGGGKTAPSFPIVINQPGSYKLASNLAVTDPSLSAIVVQADNVTIDLGGYTISGPNVCTASGYSVTCTYGPGAAMGVNAHQRSGTVVQNGTVRGFSASGINIGTRGRVENVLASHNYYTGVLADVGSAVDNVRSSLNGTHGVVLYGAVLRNSEVFRNQTFGIYSPSMPSLVTGNHISTNGGVGMSGVGAFGGNLINDNAGGSNQGMTTMGGNICNNLAC